MQTNNSPLARIIILVPLYLLGVFTTSIFAQDDLEQLNLVLDIEELYEPVASQQIHGETAVSLLEELQTLNFHHHLLHHLKLLLLQFQMILLQYLIPKLLTQLH